MLCSQDGSSELPLIEARRLGLCSPAATSQCRGMHSLGYAASYGQGKFLVVSCSQRSWHLQDHAAGPRFRT